MKKIDSFINFDKLYIFKIVDFVTIVIECHI